jgi:hypothetical protein
MNANHANRLQMIRRVRELVGDRANDPVLQEPVSQLDAVLARLRESSVTQDNALRRRRSLTASINASARALRLDLLRPAYLAMAAAFPGGDGEVESLRQATRPPAQGANYERLLVAARSMAQAIEGNEAAFVAAALPAGFAARLRGAADALEGLIVARSNEEQRRAAATRGNDAESKRGVALVRLISALIQPSLRGDPQREVAWAKAVKLAFRPASSARGETPAPVPVPTPTPTPAPVPMPSGTTGASAAPAAMPSAAVSGDAESTADTPARLAA